MIHDSPRRPMNWRSAFKPVVINAKLPLMHTFKGIFIISRSKLAKSLGQWTLSQKSRKSTSPEKGQKDFVKKILIVNWTNTWADNERRGVVKTLVLTITIEQ